MIISKKKLSQQHQLISESEKDILEAGETSKMELSASLSDIFCSGSGSTNSPYVNAFNCSMWCFSGLAKQSVTLNLGQHYLVTTITVEEVTSSKASAYKIFTSSDGSTFKDVTSSLTKTMTTKTTSLVSLFRPFCWICIM